MSPVGCLKYACVMLGNGGMYAVMSGTSCAAPQVAAVVARCYMRGACNSTTTHEIPRIMASAKDYATANRAYGYLGEDPPPPPPLRCRAAPCRHSMSPAQQLP
jgi:hypothetical protein